METFNVVCIVPVNHLTDVLKRLESLKIPYNVELNNTRAPRKVQTGTNKEFLIELLGKGPLSAKQIGDAFLASGRPRKASYGPLHVLKRMKQVKGNHGLYTLSGDK